MSRYIMSSSKNKQMSMVACMLPNCVETPHGNTPRERLQSLLKCITNAELVLSSRLWPSYRLQDLSIVGTDEAYDAFASWWRSKKLDEMKETFSRDKCIFFFEPPLVAAGARKRGGARAGSRESHYGEAFVQDVECPSPINKLRR